MNPDTAIEFAQEAALNSLTLVAPMLIVAIVVAILIGLVQSMTQIQDQTISFVPKIICIALTFVLCLPWISGRLIDYSKQMLEKPLLMNTGKISIPDSEPQRQSVNSIPNKIAQSEIQ